MTLFNVAGRARVTDVKLKSSAATGTEIVVGIAFRRQDLTEAERSALADYYGNYVHVELQAIQREDDGDGERPLDRALAEVEANGHQEQMRPLPDATCARCGELIGDDPEPRFHVPIAGPPSALHGDCFGEWAGDQEAVEERERELRAEFLAALDGINPSSELRIALVDAFDNGPERRLHALVHVGLDADPEIVLPREFDALGAYLAWLRERPAVVAPELVEEAVAEVEAAGEEPEPSPTFADLSQPDPETDPEPVLPRRGGGSVRVVG